MISLSDLVSHSVPYEATETPVDPRLRVAGWVSIAIDSALLLLIASTSSNASGAAHRPGFFMVGWGLVKWVLTVGDHAQAGLGLLVTTLTVAACLAAGTRGFATAPLAAHWAILGVAATAAIAMVLMFAVALMIVLNVALWALVIAIVIAFGVLLVYLICGMFEVLLG